MISSKRQIAILAECTEFTGHITPEGYGKYRKGENRDKFAHRVAYETINGFIPEGMCVLHKCDNRACVNINHLFLGTRNDNNKDRASKNRTFKMFGESNGNHLLTKEAVLSIRNLYSTKLFTQQQLAEEFGVARNTIGYIVRRKLWSNI